MSFHLFQHLIYSLLSCRSLSNNVHPTLFCCSVEEVPQECKIYSCISGPEEPLMRRTFFHLRSQNLCSLSSADLLLRPHGGGSGKAWLSSHTLSARRAVFSSSFLEGVPPTSLSHACDLTPSLHLLSYCFKNLSLTDTALQLNQEEWEARV